MKILRAISFFGICLFGLPACFAAESVSNWLSQPILSPTQTVAELQAYIEPRIPRMPNVTTSAQWQSAANRLRRDMLDRVVFRGEASRWRDAKTKVEWLETIDAGSGYHIKKLRYEALPGFWIPALLYEPDQLNGKVPVVLNLNGHEPPGKAVLNKQIRCINLAKRGMLALSPDWLGIGQLNGPNYKHSLMNQIDFCGASGLAPFYLAMQRGLDLLLALEHADHKRVAVAGLSGGGWQTIFLSALDARVTLADPVAGYSSLRTRVHHESDLGDSEQHPCDMATVLDYTHLTAMLAPRPTLLTYNAKDNCCFASAHALPPLLEAAQPIFQLLGKPQNLRTHINYDPGTHNFDRENREAFYQMLSDHFHPGNNQFSAVEIPCDDETNTAAQLNVPLPENNADFHSLALALSENLPRHAKIPRQKKGFNQWQRTQRENLRDLVRASDYLFSAKKIRMEQSEGIAAIFWQLQCGSDWTLPLVELSRGEPRGTTILIADDGKQNAADAAIRLLAAGQRVLALDLFYFGEAKLGKVDVRYALLVGAVGERPLGIQAGQLSCVARWAKSQRPGEKLNLAGAGARSSLIALVAAGLNPAEIDGLELQAALPTLKEIIRNNWSVDQKPEMFCFGLLEAFDVPQLEALVLPRPLVRQ